MKTGRIEFVADVEDYECHDMSFDVIHDDGSKTHVWMPNEPTYSMPDDLSEDSTPWKDLRDGDVVTIEAVGATENYHGTEFGTLYRVLKVQHGQLYGTNTIVSEFEGAENSLSGHWTKEEWDAH